MKYWLLGPLLAAAAAQAAPPPAALRDPMQPPVARRSVTTATTAPAEAASAPAVRHLYAVGDQRWVVQGGRRYGVGDLLDGARIERIDDSGVVVRQGGTAVRLPLYAGVTKRPAAAASAAIPTTRTALAAPGGADRPPR